jgi:CubicO group peptidase (beta-lactamase class C family)
MNRKLKGGAGLVMVLALSGAIYFLNSALPIGTGYSAKYLCSHLFLAGQDPAQVFEMDVKPTHFLFKPVRFQVDYDAKAVTARAFGFWKPMTAAYREGCGCTLVVDTDLNTLYAQTNDISPIQVTRTDAPWPSGSRVETGILPVGVDKKLLDSVMAEAFTEPGPDTRRNTRAIVIVLGDRIIAEAYADGYDNNTPFLGWSMCKSVSSTLAGILVKDGTLDIYAPAPVPAWHAAEDPRNRITLDMMLRMSSGLAFEESYAPFADATDMLYASRSMAAFAAAKPLAAEPDTLWSYASGTTNILSKIIMDHTGGTLAGFYTFAMERLFLPLHMYSAVIEPDASGAFVGSSYMFATARDWARYGLFLKKDGVWNGNRLLPEGWMTYATTPAAAAPQGQYGAHFWLNAGDPDRPENRLFPSLPRDLYYCGGFNKQIVAVIPSKDLVVVRLGVTHDDSWDHEWFIRQVLAAVNP